MENSSVAVLRRPGPRRSDVLTALSWWTPRHVLVAAVSAVAVAVLIGVPSVLIPNSFFVRDIPPVWWNYPVWLLTSGLTGMLIASYVRAGGSGAGDNAEDGTDAPAEATHAAEREVRRSSRLGLAGGVLAWFAVGCPVCNKLVLLALGYSGALTWFAPAQAYLALAGLVLTGIALYLRLRGQVSCPVPTARKGSGT